MKIFFLAISLFLIPANIFWFTGCIFTSDELPPVAQGGGSDSETLTGFVFTASGKPAARSLVKLIPSNYDPSKPDLNMIRYIYTNDSGRFQFKKVDSTQSYNLISGGMTMNGWGMLKSVRTGSSNFKKSLQLNLSSPKVFLFSLHTSIYETKDSGIAFFPGTDILTHCDGINASKVDSVPAGAMHFIVQSKAGWKQDTTLVSVPDTLIVKAQSGGITYGP